MRPNYSNTDLDRMTGEFLHYPPSILKLSLKVSETASADSTEKLTSLHLSEKVSSKRNRSAAQQQTTGEVKHCDSLTDPGSGVQISRIGSTGALNRKL